MTNALLGATGFVGSTLQKQTVFQGLYRSTNADEISSSEHNMVVCAAAPAQKWIANRDPAADRANVDRLMATLRSVRCKRFVLISTVDVFPNPNAVTESTFIDATDLQPYGANRRRLEILAEETFERCLVVRLPGLVGPGLRKNIIYDLLNGNALHAVDSRAVFQFYPMVNLWSDIQTAIAADLSLIHLTAEPISVHDVANEGFGIKFENMNSGTPACYDMQSEHTSLYSSRPHYTYSRRETLLAIRAYAQSESPKQPAL